MPSTSAHAFLAPCTLLPHRAATRVCVRRPQRRRRFALRSSAAPPDEPPRAGLELLRADMARLRDAARSLRETRPGAPRSALGAAALSQLLRAQGALARAADSAVMQASEALRTLAALPPPGSAASRALRSADAALARAQSREEWRALRFFAWQRDAPRVSRGVEEAEKRAEPWRFAMGALSIAARAAVKFADMSAAAGTAAGKRSRERRTKPDGRAESNGRARRDARGEMKGVAVQSRPVAKKTRVRRKREPMKVQVAQAAARAAGARAGAALGVPRRAGEPNVASVAAAKVSGVLGGVTKPLKLGQYETRLLFAAAGAVAFGFGSYALAVVGATVATAIPVAAIASTAVVVADARAPRKEVVARDVVAEYSARRSRMVQTVDEMMMHTAARLKVRRQKRTRSILPPAKNTAPRNAPQPTTALVKVVEETAVTAADARNVIVEASVRQLEPPTPTIMTTPVVGDILVGVDSVAYFVESRAARAARRFAVSFGIRPKGHTDDWELLAAFQWQKTGSDDV